MTAKTYEQIWSQGAELLKKHKQPRTVSPLWTALVKHQGEKMNEEDEAFEQLSLKQGSWEHTSGWRKKQIKEYEEMAIDNSTGKDKEFYDLGKKMFDRIQPITRGVPQIPQERYSKRPWVGLTDKEILADDVLRYHFGLNGGGGPVSKSGRKIVDAIEKKLKELNQ